MTFLSHQIWTAERPPSLCLQPDCGQTACGQQRSHPFLLHVSLWAPWPEAITGCDPEPLRKQERKAEGELRKESKNDKPTWKEDAQGKKKLVKCIVDFSLIKKKKLKKITPSTFTKALCFNHALSL